MKPQKIDTTMRDKLFSANTEIVLATIETLREKGNKGYLPMLFDILISAPEAEVEKAILTLLENVKDKETIPVFIEVLQNKKYKDIRKEIATTCWQNGLDFSMHMEIFVDLIITESWEVAFEAFTVIENLEHFPPEDVHKAIQLKIASALRTADEQKQYFLEEILRMSS